MSGHGPEGYAELCVTSNFTFLHGASHPEELVARAAELGLAAIAITDRNSLAGVVRAHVALRELARAQAEGLPIRSQRQTDSSSRQTDIGAALPAPQGALPRLVVGARLVLADSAVEWLALPLCRAGYAGLSRLLSLGKRRAPKGQCDLRQAELLARGADMVLNALPPDHCAPGDLAQIRAVAASWPGKCYLGAAPRYDGGDGARLEGRAHLAARLALPMVAVGDVLMHAARRRKLADVLACLRLGCTIDGLGARALPNAEARLKSGAEMARIFARHPAAIRRTLEIADRCAFSLDELSYEYPDEIADGEPAQARLERLVQEGLWRRFPDGTPPDTAAKVAKELRIIKALGFAAYFLTVHDIVAFARGRGILCQGRGSAANSVICYALGITEVAPDTISMVFERFMSEARGEPPDIDVDFEHERREEVIQHIYARYGRERAGLTATVIHFRARAAVREVGKVMGLSGDMVSALASSSMGWRSGAPAPERLAELGLDATEPRLAQTMALIAEIIGFPRHLSQHVGGFVITKGRLDALCPIENAAMEGRTVIEWDKDDINALGILKVDILSLGMLTCIRKCFDLVAGAGGKRYTLENLPREDGATYDMLCRADAVGVFQVESRAQMNFLPRMRPRCFYDLVIEVAIVRPGPIQGGMVHPYIRRRQGKEAVHLPSPELRGVLERTLGVPLFQEQAMQIAVVAAGFTPEEADRLRRSLATFKRMGTIGSFRDRFLAGMAERGYTPDFAASCFAQIEGFGEYGFPESHAASFALLVYASAWLKRHHPSAFACALLNSQPMGFYAPAQIVRDLRDHGIEVRPVSVNHSHWDCTLERRANGSLALRLGFRQVRGMGVEDAEWIVAARANGYPDLDSLWRRAGVAPATLTRLAEADALACLGLDRRAALWAVRALRAPKPLPLFDLGLEGESIAEHPVTLPPLSLGEAVVEDYLTLRLSLRAHPMELLRPGLPGIEPHQALAQTSGRVAVCGLVITRQRPGTASGVIFITLEDETGVSNIVVWPKVYEHHRRAVLGGRLLRVTGRVQREGAVIHVIAERIEDCSDMLGALGRGVIDPTQGRADEARRPVLTRQPRSVRHPREQARQIFPSRDFH
ncbi:MAG: error-prone DNA polymerase [Roseinatronobacter sp.]|nr:error-prone DNA polymerase [Roseinatronobacter sp.]